MIKDSRNGALAETLVAEEDEDTLKGMFLTFPLGNEEYGVEIRHVTEIVGIQKITEVPNMPIFIKGVINLRGRVIPVMDVRLRFNLKERQYDDQTCIFVVNIDGETVGLVVDNVSEVMNIPSANIDPPPKLRRDKSSMYILGLGKVGEKVNILLDVPKLLFEEEIEKIKEAVNAEDQAPEQLSKAV